MSLINTATAFLFGQSVADYFAKKEELLGERGATLTYIADAHTRNEFQVYLVTEKQIAEQFNQELDELIDQQLPSNGTASQKFIRFIEKTL